MTGTTQGRVDFGHWVLLFFLVVMASLLMFGKGTPPSTAAPKPPVDPTDALKEQLQQGWCLDRRVEFFKACMSDEGSYPMERYQCEVQWAQLRGHVFENSPDLYISREVDCARFVQNRKD